MVKTVTPDESVALFHECSWAGHDVYDVWEPADRFYDENGEVLHPTLGANPPNRVGCADCNYMVRIDWGF